MIEVLDALERWRREGVPVGRAVLVRASGSAPRPEGAVLIATADGRVAGSVSGGCVEAAVVVDIDEVRRSGRARVTEYGFSDATARDAGLACGGRIGVLVEPHVRPEILSAATARGRAVVTALPAEDALGPAGVVVSEDGSAEGSTGDAAVDRALVGAAQEALEVGRSGLVEVGSRSYFVEVFASRPRLVIVGAVQVAIPLVSMAGILGYETIVIDGRSAFATPERFPGVDRLIVGWPDDVAGQIALGPADSVAVLSHDPKFDEPAIVEALRCGCRYVGAIGSRRTQADRRTRLHAAGLTDADLERLRGPIGLDLGGRDAAEMALAIMAEVIAARFGGSGAPMRDAVTLQASRR
ncbi:MAG: XdhC family protein [Chloroflexota bacterium]|nr:XdhC family protein [Chloroflexota bacterium]